MPDAVVIPTDARRVDLVGDDRLRYLEDVTSQHLEDVAVGHVRGALYLDTHGAPLAMFDVVALGDRLALIAPDPTVVDTLVEVLGGRTFLLDARFEPTEAQVIAIRGPDAAEVLAAVGLGAVEGRARLVDGMLVISRGQDAVDLAGPPAGVAEVAAALRETGVADGGPQDLDRWRIEAGVPAWGAEVVAPHLPEEAGLLPTHVHLAKGCYPGQEAVARMWMLGRPRRRLARVAAVGARLEPGHRIGKGRQEVAVTTANPEGDRALAFVPAGAAPGDRFTSDDDTGVEVVALIGDDPAPPGHDPAMVRRRDRAPAGQG